ncbi:MAG: hypothetical protein ACRCVJ_11835 [Clostridium sp.]|uniref:hypothetical protein n=1 Tax=Clostridium sp. TaxID=1506 RepID=UPI003F414F37
MTCIIGYKDKEHNKIYIGADSCISGIGEHTLEKCYKIFKPEKNSNIVIGVTGSVRALQVLKYHMNFPSEKELAVNDEKFDDKYIVKNIIPKLQRICTDNKIIEKDNCICLVFIIGYKDKLWYIDMDFALIQYTNDYLTHGCGYAYAEGSLLTTKDMDFSIVDKVKMGLQASSVASGVCPPYYIMNTENDEVITYES